MIRSMFAMLFLGALAIATTAARPAPAQAAPSSVTAPEFGACRWYCGSKSFTTRSACQASCSEECEQIC